jgi:hypothetical protein
MAKPLVVTPELRWSLEIELSWLEQFLTLLTLSLLLVMSDPKWSLALSSFD